MFLARSAFWLGVAYLVIHPGAGDIAGAARSASSQIAAASRQAVAQGMQHCATSDCIGVAITALTVAAPALTRTHQGPADVPVAPVPRPRPARLG